MTVAKTGPVLEPFENLKRFHGRFDVQATNDDFGPSIFIRMLTNEVVPNSATIEDSNSDVNDERIPYHVQKQLAQDIEDFGGIQTVAKGQCQILCQICNRRPEVYGKRGDPLRKSLSNKVNRWRLLSKKEYRKKVLAFLQIPPRSKGTIANETPKKSNLDYTVPPEETPEKIALTPIKARFKKMTDPPGTGTFNSLILY